MKKKTSLPRHVGEDEAAWQKPRRRRRRWRSLAFLQQKPMIRRLLAAPTMMLRLNLSA